MAEVPFNATPHPAVLVALKRALKAAEIQARADASPPLVRAGLLDRAETIRGQVRSALITIARSGRD